MAVMETNDKTIRGKTRYNTAKHDTDDNNNKEHNDKDDASAIVKSPFTYLTIDKHHVTITKLPSNDCGTTSVLSQR